jgi:hypothetical protein
MRQRLSRRAITGLLKGSHKKIGGNTLLKRAKNMVVIATSYSLEELLDESGIGLTTAMEIQFWLGDRGLTLRPARRRGFATSSHREGPTPTPRIKQLNDTVGISIYTHRALRVSLR